MPQPLDYFTPGRRDEPMPAEPRAPHGAAIPVEFDTSLTHTSDHAAARAVEAELDRHGIAFFRAEAAGHSRRGVELHVRSADHARASQLAGMIFARRQRLDRIAPRPKPPRGDLLVPPED
jgi:hypothetical protein